MSRCPSRHHARYDCTVYVTLHALLEACSAGQLRSRVGPPRVLVFNPWDSLTQPGHETRASEEDVNEAESTESNSYQQRHATRKLETFSRGRRGEASGRELREEEGGVASLPRVARHEHTRTQSINYHHQRERTKPVVTEPEGSPSSTSSGKEAMAMVIFLWSARNKNELDATLTGRLHLLVQGGTLRRHQPPMLWNNRCLVRWRR